MSGEAQGWVWRHSPYVGATLMVHLAIADVVNDTHGNEMWLSVRKLAAKARVSVGTASEALNRLATKGPDPTDGVAFLEVLESPDPQRQRAGRYRFLFPDIPATFSTDPVRPLNTPRSPTEHPPRSVSEQPVQSGPHIKKNRSKETQEGSKASTPAIAASKTPKAKPAPKPKAPPHPETQSLVAHFLLLADTPTLKRAQGQMQGQIKKALTGGSAAADIRVAIERVVREGAVGRFGTLLNGVERQHRSAPAPPDTPLARGVLALAAAAKAGERWDGEEAQSLGQIAQRFDLTGGAEQ